MRSILIIKTSSLGDIVHNLPIVNDIHRAAKQDVVDWVVEEAYAPLVALHPGVDRVIPVAQRRWRRSSSKAAALERRGFEERLIEREYDVVLDTQGLLKSAVLARAARLSPTGLRIGFSRRAAREGLARLFYDLGIEVDWHLHAVERARALAAQALGYEIEGGPEFGLKVPWVARDWLAGRDYAVLLHATARAEKKWARANWIELGQSLLARNLAPVLLHGTDAEEGEARAIAAQLPGATVAPRMDLPSAASLLAAARIVIGVDTGLTHLAAALEVPTIALFGATLRRRYAPYWTTRAVSLGDHGVQPSFAEVQGVLGRCLSADAWAV